MSKDKLTKLKNILSEMESVVNIKEIGFSYTTLDLKGYRTGSMNEVLENRR